MIRSSIIDAQMADRLQKILSQAGVASRRAAEKLIAEGRVSVNGTTVREMGTKADPSVDDIRVDGRRIKRAERLRYILLNKPAGYVTTRSDPQRRPTVIDLLRGVRDYVYPVGRLDYDTEGLLLLTNDGDLAAKLTHPRHGVERTYEARVAGMPGVDALERLRKGLVLDGRRTRPADVDLLSRRGQASASARVGSRRDPTNQRWLDGPQSRTVPADKKAGHSDRPEQDALLRITIREGRNRQVRRMCEAVGHPVKTLARTGIGSLTDRHLKPGMWRELRADELRALKKTAATPRAAASPREGRAREGRRAD
jgi:pseudouridine synthase